MELSWLTLDKSRKERIYFRIMELFSLWRESSAIMTKFFSCLSRGKNFISSDSMTWFIVIMIDFFIKEIDFASCHSDMVHCHNGGTSLSSKFQKNWNCHNDKIKYWKKIILIAVVWIFVFLKWMKFKIHFPQVDFIQLNDSKHNLKLILY